ncbi:restriction endonuclease subunit S [Nostoc sp.]|uniref:restriction endonuclease subunit S n=1 Tax=Nostoc sp. TaxID=1180 RepID=UPI002FFCFD67
MFETPVITEEFKDSPIGKIPKDWDVVELVEEINIVHGYAFKGEYFSETPPGEVLLVPGNFHREGGLYFEQNNTKYYQGAIPENTVLSNGDLLIVMTDLSPRTLILGRVVQLRLPFKVLHNQRIGKIVLRLPDSWNKRFLMLVMNSNRVRQNIISTSSGTTVRHTSPGRITANMIPKPGLYDQDGITEILDAIDKTIALTNTHITKLKKAKAGLLHNLLTRGIDDHGELRDYTRNPELFKRSPLGIIPKDWDVGPLSSIANLQVGYAFKSQCFQENEGIRLIRGENVGYGRPDWSDTKRLPWDMYRGYKEYELSEGNIIIGMDRTFTKSGCKISVLDSEDIPSLLVQRVGRFIAYSCNIDFLKVLLMSETYQLSLQLQQKGMDIPHLSQSEILEPIVPIPLPKEQIKIAQVVATHEAHLQSKKVYLEKLKLLKKGLMSDLLTGRVRVKI